MSLETERDAYIAGVLADVSSQTGVDTISPVEVGNIGIELVNLLVPYIIASSPTISESITFTGAGGTATIDFNIGTRLANFGTNPTVLMYSTEDDSDIKAFFSIGYSFNTATNILTIDGVFGDKTIVLKS